MSSSVEHDAMAATPFSACSPFKKMGEKVKFFSLKIDIPASDIFFSRFRHPTFFLNNKCHLAGKKFTTSAIVFIKICGAFFEPKKRKQKKCTNILRFFHRFSSKIAAFFTIRRCGQRIFFRNRFSVGLCRRLQHAFRVIIAPTDQQPLCHGGAAKWNLRGTLEKKRKNLLLKKIY